VFAQGTPPTGAPPAALTDAERIARLLRSIETDKSQLISLRESLIDPEGEYPQAEEEFQELDDEWVEFNKSLEKLRKEEKPEEAAELEKKHSSLKGEWERAKKRLDLAIQERKTQQELIQALQKKIQEDTEELRKVKGEEPEEPADSDPTTPEQPPATAPPATTPPVTSPGPMPISPFLPGNPTPPKPRGKNPPEVEGKSKKEEPASPAGKEKENRQLEQAREEAHQKAEAAQVAQSKADSITKRIDALRANIELDEKLLETTRKKVTQSQQALAALEEEFFKQIAAGADEAIIQEIHKQRDEARKRLAQAGEEVEKISKRVEERRSELQAMVVDQMKALQEAEAKRSEAETAKQKVQDLQDPFHPHNINLWFRTQGVRIVAILLGMVLLRWLARVFSRRIVKVMNRKNSGKRGTEEDRENRSETLVQVFQNFSVIVIMIGGSLMIMDELGVPIGPLMGGAAVIGLAVAFGAQNLIRDYFTGFMVLMEDQYSINDVVKINGIAGSVQQITLRMTVLRDIEGTVHFIPHGTITTVSNLTHGWSRAFFEIGVAYKENVDKVMRILMELAMQMRRDLMYGPLIAEDPEMLGVDQFTDSAVTIKFFIKTRPLKQWIVKRELLRRIKNRFDEMGIEIPFPHRTVFHRYEKDEDACERHSAA
jgi:small conductance mechanosensitive channel